MGAGPRARPGTPTAQQLLQGWASVPSSGLSPASDQGARAEATGDRAPRPVRRVLDSLHPYSPSGHTTPDGRPPIISRPSARTPRARVRSTPAGTHATPLHSADPPSLKTSRLTGQGLRVPNMLTAQGSGLWRWAGSGGSWPSGGAPCTQPRQPFQEPQPRGEAPSIWSEAVGPSADLGALEICTVFCADLHATCDDLSIF